MAYGSPTDPVGGTVITVAYAQVNILDPVRWLRLMTGNADPPGSSYVVVSDSTTGTTWRKIPTDALADGAVTSVKLAAGVAVANLGYTPVNKAGDTIVKNTGAVDANTYTRAGITLNTSDGSRPALAFARDGTGAVAFYFEAFPTLRMIDNGGQLATFWNDLNDGPSSGLAAQTAATATSASDSAALGGSAAALYALLNAPNFTGRPTFGSDDIPVFKVLSWSGSGGSGGQKATGFLCKYVRIYGTSGSAVAQFDVASGTASQNMRVSGTGTSLFGGVQTTTRLHGSDGFIVDATDGTDAVGYTYFALAFG